jgi:hypothetical protein
MHLLVIPKQSIILRYWLPEKTESPGRPDNSSAFEKRPNRNVVMLSDVPVGSDVCITVIHIIFRIERMPLYSFFFHFTLPCVITKEIRNRIIWHCIKQFNYSGNLTLWHPLCECRTRSNKDVVRLKWNSFITNPVAATCFGRAKQPSSDRMYHKMPSYKFYIFYASAKSP